MSPLNIDPRSVDPKELDKRISYDEIQDRWSFKDDNDHYEYNTVLNKWISMDDIDSSNHRESLIELKKRKLQQMKEEKLAKKKQRVNTGVYVSNLPLDCDSVELNQLFSRYGVISQDLLTNKPRIKRYVDSNGQFKGDALIVYLKPESVDLAIQMLDDAPIRVGDNSNRIKVEKAQFKPENDTDDTSTPKERRVLDDKERELVKKRLRQLNSRIENWQGDDDNNVNLKWQKTMVLKRAFTLDELKEDPEVLQDIEEDIMEECGKFGKVEKIIVFDLEEEGVVLVRFTEPDSTTKCIEVRIFFLSNS